MAYELSVQEDFLDTMDVRAPSTINTSSIYEALNRALPLLSYIISVNPSTILMK